MMISLEFSMINRISHSIKRVRGSIFLQM